MHHDLNALPIKRRCNPPSARPGSSDIRIAASVSISCSSALVKMVIHPRPKWKRVFCLAMLTRLEYFCALKSTSRLSYSKHSALQTMAPQRSFTGLVALLLLLVCTTIPACAQQLSADVSAALSETDSLASLLDTLELAKCRAGLPSKLPCPGMPSPDYSGTTYLMMIANASTCAQVRLLPPALPQSLHHPLPPSLHHPLTPLALCRALLHPQYILPAPSRLDPCLPRLHRRPSPQPRHQAPPTASQARNLEICDAIKLIDNF